MVGNTIVHASFGEGVIVKWNDQTFSVKFDTLGTKLFDRAYSMKFFPEALLNAYEAINRARNAIKIIGEQLSNGEITCVEYLSKTKEVADHIKFVGPDEMVDSDSAKKRNAFASASFIRDYKTSYSPETIANTSKVWKSIFKEQDELLEIEKIKMFSQMSSRKREENWLILDDTEMKMKVLFVASKIGRLKTEAFHVPELESFAFKALGKLVDCNNAQQRAIYFNAFHTAIQSEITDHGWDLNQSLNYHALFPKCSRKETEYCEGKPWPSKNKAEPFDRAAYCPRTRLPCMESEGARIWPQNELNGEQWTLLELFSNEHIIPCVSGLSNAEDYVPKMAGWLNRINEIRNRLRCTSCDSVMISNKKYSMNFAAYNATVFDCVHGKGHDHNVYLSHCWACRTMIDSRINRIQDKEGYYLCIECGNGSRYSRSNPGEICPQCGTSRMKQDDKWNRVFHCARCNHTITVPNIKRSVVEEQANNTSEAQSQQD